MRPLIVLFAKAPVPGRVKTRLGIDPERAAQLHSAFVHETLTTLKQLAPGVDIELSTDLDTDAWSEFHLPRSLQSPGDLGHRMFASIHGALHNGRPSVMILGSDSPGLPAGHLLTLLQSLADVAIGPAEDGGYYAICCRRAHAAMFQAVRWSTADALADTLLALERCGLTVELGPRWFDVDTPEDLARLGP